MGKNSPCIKICKLNEDNFCIGCGRSTEEISLWSRFSPMEQQQKSMEARMRMLQGKIKLTEKR